MHQFHYGPLNTNTKEEIIKGWNVIFINHTIYVSTNLSQYSVKKTVYSLIKTEYLLSVFMR